MASSLTNCLIKDIRQHYGDQNAIVWHDNTCSYARLANMANEYVLSLKSQGVQEGNSVMLEGDYSPDCIARLLALFSLGCIVSPFLKNSTMIEDIRDISEVHWKISSEGVLSSIREGDFSSPILAELRERGKAGLVLYSSGSTGRPKASVHDVDLLLAKYTKKRFAKKTLALLLFDHIGGLDNLFYTIFNGGELVAVDPLTADESCRCVERYRVQVFPASPSFLNLLLIGEAYRDRDLSSVEVVTYGAEVMPEGVLKRLQGIFPQARFVQKYGLTEIGTLRSKSKSSDSLWVKIGGEGFDTRVVDGMLQIKAQSAMLGYLNAPSPFTEDGWFMTGDEVEVDGEYYLIKGRRSEIINVGGQKVYPAEVESVIQEMDNVIDVVVIGQKNPILGHMVTAKVNLATDETEKDFTKRMRSFCKSKLQSYQIPQKVSIESKEFSNARFKKVRKES